MYAFELKPLANFQLRHCPGISDDETSLKTLRHIIIYVRSTVNNYYVIKKSTAKRI